MSLTGPRFVPFRLASILVLVISFFVVGLKGGAHEELSPAGDGGQPAAPEIALATAEPTAPATSLPPVTTFAPPPPPTAAPSPTEAPAAGTLTPDELMEYEPNELGVVPVLEYHMITTDPEEEAQFVRMADDMRADLQWLYDHDFYIVPLRDVVTNTIAVPAGKHPVALTFDDGTSTQFAFIKNDQGELVPDPDTAIGILEAFSDAHPDFGRGGHFALLVFNGFANPDVSQQPYLEQKIQWMVERGYEIGNHTWQHTNLTDIPTDEFQMTVAEPIIWADEMIGDVPENASRILTLPFGTTPDGDLHPDQRKMLREGFTYKGQEFHIISALLVGADPSKSPANSEWDPYWIPRIQMFDDSVDFWFGQFSSGGVVLYTSDGNPDTIAVPGPLPAVLEGQLDVTALTGAGKAVIQYDPATGEQARAPIGNPLAVRVDEDRRSATARPSRSR